jgi:hypothetical protein
MFKHFITAAVSCLVVAQCAGTSVKIMPEYKGMNVEKSKLGIILLRENIVIADSTDVAEHLGSGETNQVFHDFFTSQLNEFAQDDGKFADVAIVSGCDASGFTRTTENLPSDTSLSLRIPGSKAFVSDSLPYLLILDYITVSREKKQGTTVVVMGMNGIPIRKKTGAYDRLVLKGTFLLWDNLAGKLAAFGKLKQTSEVLTVMTKTTWIDLVKNISLAIFANVPYGKMVNSSME